ncbi:hypothetical protein RDE2_20320 [Rhodococcus sp. RDE2]|nr:hypothetical protein RDE2_20320 [Rhodococcus sp. RDE2]
MFTPFMEIMDELVSDFSDGRSVPAAADVISADPMPSDARDFAFRDTFDTRVTGFLLHEQ